MTQTRTVILLHYRLDLNVPIQDRIEYDEISKQVISLSRMDEALQAVPSEGKCVIVTDSLIASNNFKENKEAFEIFVKKIKEKNAECKIILYAFDFLDLPEELFDLSIGSTQTDSYDQLMEKIQFFLK